MNQINHPDYLFEVSWEVCNKVGGIHTVITTKAKACVNKFNDQYICVGPDVWRSTHDNPEFVEDPNLYADWRNAAHSVGLHVRIGRWQVVGNPIVFLIDFTPYIDQKDEVLSTFWDDYKLDSLTGQWDYIEPALFGYGVGKVIEHFTDFHVSPQEEVLAHFQEWMTGTGLLYLKGQGEILQPNSMASRYLTHYLVESENDPIINRLNEVRLHNNPEDRIKVFFVPSYLDGADGIVNLSYYETLIGLDYTVFPSYYEPWGYTPLESLAFHVPTVTTDLAGFGKWVEKHYPSGHPGTEVLKRLGESDEQIIRKIRDSIHHFTSLDVTQRSEYRDNAFEVSKVALWEQQFKYYLTAYEQAIDQLTYRHKAIIEQLHSTDDERYISYDVKVNTPIWSQIIIKSTLPEELESLQKLSKNLWWSWDPDARRLFQSINEEVWHLTNQNPVELLQRVSFERLRELKETNSFRESMDNVLIRFNAYMDLEEEQDKSRLIAYFSMEYGLHASLKLYSGGLGVLAGDYLKQASDDNIPMVAVGLFYRYGYFTQTISAGGQQIATYDHQNFTMSSAEPVRSDDGKWQSISVAFPGRNVKARIWIVDVGKTQLYLLDTDFEENEEQDRSLTHHLYGGGTEHRIKQEILLGIGGIRLLGRLGIDPAIYHLNEGHAAFAGLERLYHYIDRDNLSFDQAQEVVRSTTLFTTHTPVPAGHDVFEENLVRMYLRYFPDRLKIDWNHFFHLGQMNDNRDNGRFSMSILACRLAQEINGVSKLHGEVSQKMFSGLFQGYFPEENHITYVTNGVHYGTWTADEWREVLDTNGDSRRPQWDVLSNISDETIWSIRSELRNRLLKLILERSSNKAIIEFENPSYIRELQRRIDPKSLVIGFARRFATYKRATLLFYDLDRLEKIVNHPEKPVTFIFAGKAHPRDTAGQDLIKRVVEISKLPAFIGKIIFLQNYDMELAKTMVSGVDIWLNTPTRPLEASGTSGQKVVMNGGLHFSVLDGWWVEGYLPDAGWALPLERTYLDQYLQDELDADHIYTLLEGEITEAYFDRDEEDVPSQWVGFIRKSMTQIAPQFTSHRMIMDYQQRLYEPLIDRSRKLNKNRYAGARYLISWKKKILKNWDQIRVIEHEKIKMEENKILAGQKYRRKLVLDPGDIPDENIGVELVVGESRDELFHVLEQIPYELVSKDAYRLVYELEFEPVLPGIFEISTRIYIKNVGMAYRSDLPFVRWI